MPWPKGRSLISVLGVERAYQVKAKRFRAVQQRIALKYGEEAPRYNSIEEKAWRQAVIERDKFCQHCGSTEELEAHHKLSWADFPELRFTLSNGEALCRICHQEEEAYLRQTANEQSLDCPF